MIRFFVIRLVLPLLLFFLIRSILKSLFAGFRSYTASQPRASQPPSVPAGGELRKDPVCGTYVSTSASVTRTVNGQLLHFCSAQCRDKYRVA